MISISGVEHAKEMAGGSSAIRPWRWSLPGYQPDWPVALSISEDAKVTFSVNFSR